MPDGNGVVIDRSTKAKPKQETAPLNHLRNHPKDAYLLYAHGLPAVTRMFLCPSDLLI